MYLSTVISVAVSLLILVLGGITLKNNRKSIVSQAFALFNFIVGLWIFSTILLKLFPSSTTGFLTISLGVSIGISFFLLAQVYPASTKKPSLKFYTPFLILIVLLLVGGLSRTIIMDVEVTEEGILPVFGPLYPPLMLYVSAPPNLFCL